MRVIDNIFEKNSIYNLLDAVYNKPEIDTKGTYQDFVELIDDKIWALSEKFNVERIAAFYKGKYHFILKVSQNPVGEFPISTFVFVEKINGDTLVTHGISYSGTLEIVDWVNGGNFAIFANEETSKELFSIEAFLSNIVNFVEVDRGIYFNLYSAVMDKENPVLKDSKRYNFEIEEDGSTLFHDKISAKAIKGKITETNLPLITYGRIDDDFDKSFYALGIDFKMYVLNGVLCSSTNIMKTDAIDGIRKEMEAIVKYGTGRLVLNMEEVELNMIQPISYNEGQEEVIRYAVLRVKELEMKFNNYKTMGVVENGQVEIDTFVSTDIAPVFKDYTQAVANVLQNNPSSECITVVEDYVQVAGRYLDYMLLSPVIHEEARNYALGVFNNIIAILDPIQDSCSKVSAMRLISFLNSKMPLSAEGVKEILENIKLTADKAWDKTGTFFSDTYHNVGEAIKALPVLIGRLSKLASEYKKTNKIRVREKMLNDEIIPELKIITSTILGGITTAGVWYFFNPFLGVLAGLLVYIFKHRIDKMEEDTIKRFIYDEMDIIDIKIQQAQSKGDDKAVVRMTRMKKELAEKGMIIDKSRFGAAAQLQQRG